MQRFVCKAAKDIVIPFSNCFYSVSVLIKELLLLLGGAALAVLVPLLSHCHSAFQDTRNAVPPGPHFPSRAPPELPHKAAPPRPFRPMVQMCVPHAQLQARKVYQTVAFPNSFLLRVFKWILSVPKFNQQRIM